VTPSSWIGRRESVSPREPRHAIDPLDPVAAPLDSQHEILPADADVPVPVLHGHERHDREIELQYFLCFCHRLVLKY
jgi:hypothetical protein